MGVYRIMELLQKIDIFLNDTTVTGDVAVNNARGKIDVIGGECPKGMAYDKIKKVCVPSKNESGSVSAMVAGSGQTRVVGRKNNIMPDLKRKNPVEIEMDDPTDENIIGRKPLKFSDLLGAYVPDGWEN
jgi:hypothetical protein